MTRLDRIRTHAWPEDVAWLLEQVEALDALLIACQERADRAEQRVQELEDEKRRQIDFDLRLHNLRSGGTE